MRVFKESIGWKVTLHWLLGATALLYVLSRFLPCAPQKHYGIIDDSWVQVLHTAFQQHWQFGCDIVFTFGPWGFLYGGFFPATRLLFFILLGSPALPLFWGAPSLGPPFFFKAIIF